MRASTLATLDVVCTVPDTTCPPCATGVLSDIDRIRGGASAGSRIGVTRETCGASVAATIGSSTMACDAVAYGVGVGAGAGVDDGPALGLALGAGLSAAGALVVTGEGEAFGTYTRGGGDAVGESAGDGAAHAAASC